MTVSDWTVDYGDGELAVLLPHAWRQDVPVTWEGPAVYRRPLVVPDEPCKLRFHGVSYEADVRMDGVSVSRHEGLWDAFDVDLRPYLGKSIEIEVWVTKNGGERFPVKKVLSGFLPYVFHTFGGIHKPVEIVGFAEPLENQPEQRAKVLRRQFEVDGKPTLLRGILTWGWYPDEGHTNPSQATIQREVEQLKAQGFNLVKFCLWIPPHRYLEILNEQGMFAWVELPLWMPELDPESVLEEVGRIVKQYRHHGNIVLWTAGCELGAAMPAEARSKLVELIKDLTGSPLVRDDSGGAEMYGGSLREFGDFADFHPYCDLPFYPQVLESLLPGARLEKPLLLGEFNDADIVRDLNRLCEERPFWACQDPDLNDKGVRWLHELPTILETSRFALDAESNRLDRLAMSSITKAVFVRRTVQEWVRGCGDIGGYVVTGIRDTPMSTSGFFDDWGECRFPAEETLRWNSPVALFQISFRKPPWVTGGNRPGWHDTANFFEGEVAFRIGAAGETRLDGLLVWDILHVSWADGKRPRGRVASGEGTPVKVSPVTPSEVGTIFWEDAPPGTYLLRVKFGGAANSWPFRVFSKPAFEETADWRLDDPAGFFAGFHLGEGRNILATNPRSEHVEAARAGARVVWVMTGEGTSPAPFWRESAYEFAHDPFWAGTEWPDHWERFLPITPDRTLDEEWLHSTVGSYANLMNRVDARTFREAPVLIRARVGSGMLLATTLRPFGGLGTCPHPLANNPAGQWLLHRMMSVGT